MTWQDIHGWFDFDRLYDAALKHALELSRIPRIVEVGCWLGRSTAYMAQRIKEHPDRSIAFWAIDNWAGGPTDGVDGWYKQMEAEGITGYERFTNNMRECGVSGFLHAIKKPSVEAAVEFEDKSLDFCFIDGDHSYEAVKADIAAWAPKMRPGSWLAGHDFDRDPVSRAVFEAFATGVLSVGPIRPETGNLTCWLFEIPKN